jgi:hypothetical protein
VPDYPLVEAALRLGTTTEAVRARLKRRSLDGYRDNKGHWRVLLPDGEALVRTDSQTVSGQASSRLSEQEESVSGRDRTLGELREELARLEGRLEGYAARLSDRDRELSEVKVERDRLLDLLGQAQAALAKRGEGIFVKLRDQLTGLGRAWRGQG